MKKFNEVLTLVLYLFFVFNLICSICGIGNVEQIEIGLMAVIAMLFDIKVNGVKNNE